MKGCFLYILGVVSGVVLAVSGLFFYAYCMDNGITIFEEPGKKMEDVAMLEVIQVLEDGNALVNCRSSKYDFDAPVALLMADEKSSYYDDQVIRLQKNQCVRHIGVYRYMSRGGLNKTVPIINFFAK